MERIDPGHFYLLLEQPETNMSIVKAGNRTRAACVTGEHSYKELFEQLITTYSEILHWPNNGLAANWEPLQTLVTYLFLLDPLSP